MPERQLTGTRLRQRRIDRGMRQAALAQAVGISPSYLNLIEHNRRRIGGKLLGDLARVLGVEPDMLVEGTAASVLAPLKEAAAEFRSAGPEDTRAEELIARFPGWAALIGAQNDRIQQLEGRVQRLTDRLTHDPQVASSLHEVLSTVTAIRATASILVEATDLDTDWQDRFHRNIEADSRRLSESSQALMGYLETQAETGSQVQSPVEQAEAFMARHRFHFHALERGEQPSTLLGDLPDPLTRSIVAGWLEIYCHDAEALPLAQFAPAARALRYDPTALAMKFGVGLETVFRRLAALPEGEDHPIMGLAVCDQAGVILLQKPVMEFNLPRAGAGCPLWPMYQALSQPGRPLRRILALPGSGRSALECAAVASDHSAPSFDGTARVVSTMLVRPVTPTGDGALGCVGPGCRVCPVANCESRRQPSVLDDLP